MTAPSTGTCDRCGEPSASNRPGSAARAGPPGSPLRRARTCPATGQGKSPSQPPSAALERTEARFTAARPLPPDPAWSPDTLPATTADPEDERSMQSPRDDGPNVKIRSKIAFARVSRAARATKISNRQKRQTWQPWNQRQLWNRGT
jgi:hypothetical protein